MPRVEQTFRNDGECAIYVSVEPWPECFELEPNEELTVIWDGPESGQTAQINFINERELVVWPNGNLHNMEFHIDGQEAEGRSWTFKHK